MTDVRVAPWTDEEVEALNVWQHTSSVHPFTCGKRVDHPFEEEYGDHGALRATNDGWVCAHCDYTQDWAHKMMFEAPPRSIWEVLNDRP